MVGTPECVNPPCSDTGFLMDTNTLDRYLCGKPEQVLLLGINHIYEEAVGCSGSRVRSRGSWVTFPQRDSPAASSHSFWETLPPLPFWAWPGMGNSAMQGRAGNTEGMVEAGEGVRQGQHEVVALGPLSPPFLLAHFLLLGSGLQALVWLVGTSWASGWSLCYRPFWGLWLFSPGRAEEGRDLRG